MKDLVKDVKHVLKKIFTWRGIALLAFMYLSLWTLMNAVDLIPDAMGPLGFVDDSFITLAFVMWLLKVSREKK